MKDRESGGRQLTKSLIKADQMLQIAFILPAAVFIGWIAGAGLDIWLHQHWIYMAGIMLGIATGFVQIFRMLRQLDRMPGSRPAGNSSKDRQPPADQR